MDKQFTYERRGRCWVTCFRKCSPRQINLFDSLLVDGVKMKDKNDEIKKELIRRGAAKNLVEVLLYNLQNLGKNIDRNHYARGFFGGDKELVKGIDFSQVQ